MVYAERCATQRGSGASLLVSESRSATRAASAIVNERMPCRSRQSTKASMIFCRNAKFSSVRRPNHAVPPEVENFLLHGRQPHAAGDALQLKRNQPAQCMRMRPEIAAGRNVAEPVCSFNLVPCGELAPPIFRYASTSRAARARILCLASRQSSVHPGCFIPAIARDPVFLQHVEVVRITLVSREHKAFDFQIVFAGDGDRARQIRLELFLSLTRLQAVIVGKGVGGDFLAWPGGNGATRVDA